MAIEMKRAEAEAIVQPFVRKAGQYSVVDGSDALRLLGEERYARLSRDRIRCLGPEPGTHYYWNAVDYVQDPNACSEAERRAASQQRKDPQ